MFANRFNSLFDDDITNGGGNSSGAPPNDANKPGVQIDFGEMAKVLAPAIAAALQGQTNSTQKQLKDLQKIMEGRFQTFEEKLTKKPEGEGNGNGENHKDGEGKPATPPELAILQRQIKALTEGQDGLKSELQKEREEKMAAKKDARAEAVLSQFQWPSPNIRSMFKGQLLDQIQVTEDGQYVVGKDALPLDAYVKDIWESDPALQPAKNVSGSGNDNRSGGKTLDWKNLDAASMTKQQRDDLRKEAARLARQTAR